MYYKYSRTVKKSIRVIIFFNLLKIIVSICIIFLFQYFFSYKEGKYYFFTIEKLNVINNTLLSKELYSPYWDIKKNDMSYKVTSELPIVGDDTALITHDQQNSIIFSNDCVLTSTAISSMYGIVGACSNGKIRILSLEETQKEARLLLNTIRLPIPVIATIWDESNIIVLALQKNSNDTLNNVSAYRLKERKTSWIVDTIFPNLFSMDIFSSLYSINGVGVYIATNNGVELLHNNTSRVFKENVILRSASGNFAFHIIYSQSKYKNILSMRIGRVLEFDLFEKREKDITMQMDDSSDKKNMFITLHNATYRIVLHDE